LAVAEVHVPAKREPQTRRMTFMALVHAAEEGCSVSNLDMEPAHQRALARLLATDSALRGLRTGLKNYYVRTVHTYVQDPETRQLMLDLMRSVGQEEAAKGLIAVLSTLETEFAYLLEDAAFSGLYLSDRYYVILAELHRLQPGFRS
jgi:hypothetical protein